MCGAPFYLYVTALSACLTVIARLLRALTEIHSYSISPFSSIKKTKTMVYVWSGSTYSRSGLNHATRLV